MIQAWICPSCGRTFARRGQGHECSPGLSIEEYFATGPAFERPVFEEVRAFVETLGPVIIEPVQVGIFFKRPSSWIQLRPKRAWVSLLFPVRRSSVVHRTITTKPMSNGKASSMWWFDAKLRVPGDLDDALRELLTASWHESDR